jgi:nitrite reductase/ring-hydroxylating ferredoxin subunit/uncharacterized membrane protein
MREDIWLAATRKSTKTPDLSKAMRSKASYKGHPIHPALITFPFAFLTGAFLFDALAWLSANQALWTTGRHLAIAGVATALMAAVPGFVDFLYTVPPQSSGRQRATRHMLLNLSAVALFAVSWWTRGPETSLAPVLLELAAFGMLVVAGSMGGVLVSRNQISVDHRYARAGKWKDMTVERGSGRRVAVASADELQIDQMKLLRIGDRRIVLARDGQGYVAFDDRCSHKGGSLAGGVMMCGTVQCPWHGSQFDVRTGHVKAGPAKDAIRSHAVDESGGQIHLTLS